MRSKATMGVACMLILTLLVLAAGEDEHDTCECRCCSGVPIKCASVERTTFQTPTCSKCAFSSCMKQFPDHCGAKDGSIHVNCVERTAWYLQLIPLIFIAATISLLFYGFFIKTFDGYNPMPAFAERALARTPFSPRNRSTALPPMNPRAPFAVRRPSPLSQAAPLSRPAAFQATKYGAVMEPNNSTDPLPSISLPLPSTPTSEKSNPGVSSPLLPASNQFDGVPTVLVKNGTHVAVPIADNNPPADAKGAVPDSAADVETGGSNDVENSKAAANEAVPKQNGSSE